MSCGCFSFLAKKPQAAKSPVEEFAHSSKKEETEIPQADEDDEQHVVVESDADELCIKDAEESQSPEFVPQETSAADVGEQSELENQKQVEEMEAMGHEDTNVLVVGTDVEETKQPSMFQSLLKVFSAGEEKQGLDSGTEKYNSFQKQATDKERSFRLAEMSSTVQSRSKNTKTSVKHFEDKAWIVKNVNNVKHF